MLFITDLTVHGADETHDDWQFHGTEYPPHKLCGQWKVSSVQPEKGKGEETESA